MLNAGNTPDIGRVPHLGGCGSPWRSTVTSEAAKKQVKRSVLSSPPTQPYGSLMREFIRDQYIRIPGRGWRRAGVTIVAVAVAGSLWASAAHAAILTVTTTGDPIGNSQ